MKIGLIGFWLSGRTTLFDALSQGHAREGVATVPLPDPRLEQLAALEHAKKVSYAALEWHDDLPDALPDKPDTMRAAMAAARPMDALVIVLRLFDSPYAPYHAPIDPARDLRRWLDEFVLSDLQAIENRLERLERLFQSHKESAGDRAEAQALGELRVKLNRGESLHALELGHELEARLRGFGFLTRKPLVAVANLAERVLGNEATLPEWQPLQQLCQQWGIPLVALCAPFERDLQQLPEEERAPFLEMMGLSEARLNTLLHTVYEQLGVQRFYTLLGGDVRAWLVRRGATALEAAATIHTDMAKGFIRAEVCHADEVIAAGGWHAAHRAGKVHLVGREHGLRDGDVVQIRFHV
ncbi:Ribosome-binding ATPase YchF [bacterium HR15]|nr:Ribosome-binding ATPase YchF [bacterium HR15]